MTILTAVLFLFSAVLTGCGKKEADLQQEIQAVPVSVTAVEKGELAEVSTLYGKLTPGKEVSLSSKTLGKVIAAPVKVGDKVHAGQLIIQLDDADALAQIEQNEAALAVAQAGQLETAITQEEARVNLERMQELYEQGAIPLQQLETAQHAYDRASSGRSDAMVRQAQANLNYWRNQLDNMKIVSSIKGVVANLEAEPGEMLSPNLPVATIVDLDIMEVECQVPENEINKIHKGDIINIRIPSIDTEPFEGTVTSVAPTAEAQSKCFPVKIALNNPDHLLKAGMFAEVDLIIGRKQDVLTVPKEAIVEKGDIKVVYTVTDGVAYERKVTIGISSNDLVEIVEGLQENDSVVIEGQNLIKDQAAVQVINQQ